MRKEKKIGISYYLNKKIKSIEVNGVVKRSVYMRITFNRKQSEIKCFIQGTPNLYWSEKQLATFLRHREIGKPIGIEKILLANEKVFEDIIRKKYARLGDRLFLKGISKILESYLSSLLGIVNEKSLKHLESELKNLLSKDQYEMLKIVAVPEGYFLAKALVPDLDDRLSQNLRITLQVFSSIETFLSLFNPVKLTGNANSVYAWKELGGRVAYEKFLHLVSKPTSSVWSKLDEMSSNSPNIRLFYEFCTKDFKVNKLINVVDNQMLAEIKKL